MKRLNKLIKNTLRNNSEFTKAWELNERHYGSLTGLNKEEMKIKLGEKKIQEFRRSWDVRPDPLNQNRVEVNDSEMVEKEISTIYREVQI